MRTIGLSGVSPQTGSRGEMSLKKGIFGAYYTF